MDVASPQRRGIDAWRDFKNMEVTMFTYLTTRVRLRRSVVNHLKRDEESRGGIFAELLLQRH